LAPFASPERARLYVASIIGCFSFSGLLLYFGFDFAQQTPWVLAAFFLPKTAFANILVMPFLFMLVQKIPQKHYFAGLVAIQFICLVLLITLPLNSIPPIHKAAAFGLLTSFASMPFWILFHTLMIHSISDENLGNEVSVANIGISIGSILGYTAGGLALAYTQGHIFIIACFIFLTLSTAMMIFSLPRQENFKQKSFFQALTARPLRSLNTILDGTFTFLTSFFAPVWLSAIGLGGLLTGLASAANAFLKFFVSPLAGYWIAGSNAKETRVGAIMKITGWIPWILTLNPLALIWSYVFWGMGYHLFATGLQSRWYKERDIANMAARECCLGIGRTLTCLAAIPLIYIDIKLFFVMAITLTILTYLVSLRESRF